jgi:hypothetical protein
MLALKIGSSLHKFKLVIFIIYTLTILIGITVLFGLRQFWLCLGHFYW